MRCISGENYSYTKELVYSATSTPTITLHTGVEIYYNTQRSLNFYRLQQKLQKTFISHLDQVGDEAVKVLQQLQQVWSHSGYSLLH